MADEDAATALKDKLEADTDLLDAAQDVDVAEATALFEGAVEARRVYNEEQAAEEAAEDESTSPPTEEEPPPTPTKATATKKTTKSTT